MVVSAKNVILNTTLDMRAGMDTIKVHVPEQYLRNDHNNLYVNVKRALDDRQMWSKELRNATNPIEITLPKNLVDGYTGDVYLTLSTLEGFKFFFTIKSEKSSSQKPYVAKSFYPSETIFINKIPNVELSEIDVDEISGNDKTSAKAVITKEEIEKTLFAGVDGKFQNIQNFVEGYYNNDERYPGTVSTAIEDIAWWGILNPEPDGMWARWLDKATMTGSVYRYKGDTTGEQVKLSDAFTAWLMGYPNEDGKLEKNILGRVVREHDDMKKSGVTGGLGEDSIKSIVDAKIDEYKKTVPTPTPSLSREDITLLVSQKLNDIDYYSKVMEQLSDVSLSGFMNQWVKEAKTGDREGEGKGSVFAVFSEMAIQNEHPANAFAKMHNDIKELKRVVKQLATAASIENTITIDEE